MTVIRPSSISGVTSITAQGGDITFYRADGTGGDLIINNITGVAATFTGVLSYEDVTNVDSVGVITARSGIRVGANGTKRETVHLDAGDSGVNYLRFTNTGTGNGVADGFNVGINADENALLWNFENKNTIFATDNEERLRITSDGHVSIGHAGDVDTSNGSVGKKFGIRSTANNFIVGETTSTSAGFGLHLEGRQTGRSGGARITQISMRNDSSGNGEINFQTAPSGSGVTQRCTINADGHFHPHVNATYDLGISGKAWRNLYVNDAHFSNEGGSNSVDGTWGSWTLQEGENDIFMINNRNGKKYAITMREVE